MFEFLKSIGLGLMVLLPLVNPLTTVAMFLSLSKTMTLAERSQQAKMVSVYVFIIMTVVFYTGTLVMNIFGISIPGLRIAGGLIVSFIGFHMLFPICTENNFNVTENKMREIRNHKPTNIAFVPLAIPSTAGPGTIAMIISWSSTINKNIHYSHWVTTLAPIFVFLIISAIVWIALRSSGAIMHMVGVSGMEAISRLMGFLLVCVGVQFIINGIMEVMVEYHA